MSGPLSIHVAGYRLTPVLQENIHFFLIHPNWFLDILPQFYDGLTEIQLFTYNFIKALYQHGFLLPDDFIDPVFQVDCKYPYLRFGVFRPRNAF